MKLVIALKKAKQIEMFLKNVKKKLEKKQKA